MSFSLEVFFEDPFWVGLFTLSEGSTAQYSRVVFGGEPSDNEIYHYFLRNFSALKFSELLPVIEAKPLIKNPKRRQREVSKNLKQQTGEKKSYEVVKQQIQQTQKASRKTAQKQEKSQIEEYKTQLKQAKRKEKHRGH
jgi:hypothetical protein